MPNTTTRRRRPRPEVAPAFVDMQTLLSVLGCGRSFLYNRLLPMGLPSHRIGGRRFFDPHECVQWVRDHAEHDGDAAGA